MSTPPPRHPATSADKTRPDAPREDRLKAALKANMARRKAQARARAAGADAQDDTNHNDKE